MHLRINSGSAGWSGAITMAKVPGQSHQPVLLVNRVQLDIKADDLIVCSMDAYEPYRHGGDALQLVRKQLVVHRISLSLDADEAL